MLGVGRGGSGSGRWVAEDETMGRSTFAAQAPGAMESELASQLAAGGAIGETRAAEARGVAGSWPLEGGDQGRSSDETESNAGPVVLKPSAERDAWGVLASVAGLGPLSFGVLVGQFGGASGVLEAASGSRGVERLMAAVHDPSSGDPSIRSEPILNREVAERIRDVALRAGQLAARNRQLEVQILTLDDAEYPARLREIEMPPHVLFVRGDVGALAAVHPIAVVGTRRPSEAGRRVAARIAASIATLGGLVVSGLAIGIDGAAHAAVVAERARTVAVLGGGHGHLFPQAHANLADEVLAQGGAVVSELPPDSSPTKWTFPRRNRIISGLADATVVVEAGVRSGALITAGWALEQGRECFLVPGSIDAETSAGCLAFLHEFAGQARIISSVPQLMDDLGLAPPPRRRRRKTADGAIAGRQAEPRAVAPGQISLDAVLAGLGEAERQVAGFLTSGVTTADELVLATGMSVATVLGTLTVLEMRGLVTAAYGRYRPLGRLASATPSVSRRGPISGPKAATKGG